jgi:hypothetical protein
MRGVHGSYAVHPLAPGDSSCHMRSVSRNPQTQISGSIMAPRAKSVTLRGFSFLLAAPFATLGEVLSSVIATNAKGYASR